MQQVKVFECYEIHKLERKLHEIAKEHHIDTVSYSTEKIGYATYHNCIVIYSD